MHMYHFHRYTHIALSVSYGTVYTCPMGRLQRCCMYLVVCDAVLVIIIIIMTSSKQTFSLLSKNSWRSQKVESAGEGNVCNKKERQFGQGLYISVLIMA